jgi:hypothetical protein
MLPVPLSFGLWRALLTLALAGLAATSSAAVMCFTFMAHFLSELQEAPLDISAANGAFRCQP